MNRRARPVNASFDHHRFRSPAGLSCFAAAVSVGGVLMVENAGGGPEDSMGIRSSSPKQPVTAGPPGQPLSLNNGLGMFDVRIRERFEAGDNWIDLNSRTGARDDTSLAGRLQLGLNCFPPTRSFPE
jgi:hypothetical protein